MALLGVCLGVVAGLAMGLGFGLAVGAYRLASAQRTFASAWRSRTEEWDRMTLRLRHLTDQVDGLFAERNA